MVVLYVERGEYVELSEPIVRDVGALEWEYQEEVTMLLYCGVGMAAVFEN
jgi:hypothetical protein